VQQSLFTEALPQSGRRRIEIRDAELSFYEQAFSRAESETYYAKLMQETVWRADSIKVYGKKVALPRLQAWYGRQGAYLSYSGMKLAPLPITELLSKIAGRVFDLSGLRFNGVLVTLYRDGSDGVGWHRDNEAQFGPDPVIASVSFGASRDFMLRHLTDSTVKAIRCKLTDGSLLVMGAGVQKHWKHQLPKRPRVTEGRINLTFRNVFS
jgi:alkylated DNA repair dioxygenase AlkB